MQTDTHEPDHPEKRKASDEVPSVLQPAEPDPAQPPGEAQANDSSDANQNEKVQTRSATESLKLLVNLRWWLKVSNVAVALAAVATAIISYWQYESLQDANSAARKAADAAASAADTAKSALTDNRDYFARTLEQMKGQTLASKDAAEAAKSSATTSGRQTYAALKANELTEKARLDAIGNYQRDNRAYLRFGFLMTSEPNEKGQFVVNLPLTNDRSTHAHNVRFKAVQAANTAKPTVTDEIWNKENWLDATIVFPRETGRTMTITSGLTAEQLNRYNSGANLYVFVRMRYCDAFGTAHWIDSCAHRAKGRKDNGFTLCGTVVDQESDKRDSTECQGQTQK